MEKGILACNEGKELFMRVWPIVSSWRKEQFMRKCVMAGGQFVRGWWGVWVDAVQVPAPPLVDSSDEEPPPLVDSSDEEGMVECAAQAQGDVNAKICIPGNKKKTKNNK